MHTTKKGLVKKNNTRKSQNSQQVKFQRKSQKSGRNSNFSNAVDSKNFHADIQNMSVENIKSLVDQINNEIDLEKKKGVL